MMLCRAQNLVGARKIQIDWFLTENRLARGNTRFDQIGMGVGGRRDQDCVDLRVGEDRIRCRALDFIVAGQVISRLCNHIGHSHEGRARIALDGCCMDFADAACAKKSNFHRLDPP